MSRDVLIIDDDPRARARIRAALEPEGLRVVEQGPCDRPAADTLHPGYAVMLLDIVMPEKDGFEYLRDIRRTWPDQRLIVYSHGLSDYTRYAVKLGADAGIDITRPDDLREVVETTRRLAAEAQRAAE
jgi:two-component system KDP operon response regulator KdpE